MKSIVKILYIGMGVLLLVGIYATRSNGLSEHDKDIYISAIELDGNVDSIDFPGFSLKEYKIRIFDGSHDYVLTPNNTVKENPALNVLAGTALKVDNEYQVLIPTYEQMSSLIQMIGTIGGLEEDSTSISRDSYTEVNHIATIWHEGFHVWQFNNWEYEILTLINNTETLEENSRESIIVEQIDSKPHLVYSITKELELLKLAYLEENIDKKLSYIKQALDEEFNRHTKLSSQAATQEWFCINLEGSARYVESMVFYHLVDQDSFEEVYISDVSYEKGSGKYYQMGMLKCLLLEQLDLDWKENFSIKFNLNELLTDILHRYEY